MDQIMLAAVCRIIVNRNGRRLGHPDLTTAYTQGLYADYYRTHPLLCRQVYYKYLAAVTPLPHALGRHYAGAQGYRRTLGDMLSLVDQSASISVLRQIQEDLRQWVDKHLSCEEAAAINRNYTPECPSRRDIAIYWTDVMHYALNADNAVNRPTCTAGIL